MTATNDQLWNQVVNGFRQACMLMHQGKTHESNRIIHADLPRSISTWSKISPKDAASKKTDLVNMFREEQKRVEDTWVIRGMIWNQLNEELVPTLCTRVLQEVKEQARDQSFSRTNNENPSARSTSLPLSPSADRPQRIKFDDIPGIIDALHAEYLSDLSPQPALAF
ncbi:MAG: hypothetical protein ABI651_21025 [Verrucomicrobiota bacterium]